MAVHAIKIFIILIDRFLHQAFVTSIGCKRRRASLALESVLAPVVHGALAAALAASMLATSEFGFVARLFLRLLLALVLLGLIDGLLFFPIVLAILGPTAEVRFNYITKLSFMISMSC